MPLDTAQQQGGEIPDLGPLPTGLIAVGSAAVGQQQQQARRIAPIGTQEEPYHPEGRQERIDWWNQNAPPGSWILTDRGPQRKRAPTAEQGAAAAQQGLDFSGADLEEPPPKPAEPGWLGTAGQALVKGAVTGATETGQAVAAPVAGLPKEAPAPDTSPVGKLLSQPISEGWSNPKWWIANIAYGAGEATPSYALGAAGAVAGAAIPVLGETGVGEVLGGAAGFGIGSYLQTIVPAYQRAVAAGLSHDAAVERAIEESGIAGVFGAAMGAIPGLSVFGKTPMLDAAGKAITDAKGKAIQVLKRPISEALLQIGVTVPALGAAQQAASGAVEGQMPSAEELAKGYATNVGLGVGLYGAGRAWQRLTGSRETAPATQPGATAGAQPGATPPPPGAGAPATPVAPPAGLPPPGAAVTLNMTDVRGATAPRDVKVFGYTPEGMVQIVDDAGRVQDMAVEDFVARQTAPVGAPSEKPAEAVPPSAAPEARPPTQQDITAETARKALEAATAPGGPGEPALEAQVLEDEKSAAKPIGDTTGLVEGLGGAGKAIVGNLYERLFSELQAGTNQVRDPVITQARPAFERGEIRSPDELQAWVNANYRPGAAPVQPPTITIGGETFVRSGPRSAEEAAAAAGVAEARPMPEVPIEEPPAGLPGWLNENVQASLANAQRLGLDKEIERLTAMRYSAKQIVEALRHRGIDEEFVRQVRLGMGIPSPGGMMGMMGNLSAEDAERERLFQTWQDDYYKRQGAGAAITPPTENVPEPAAEPRPAETTQTPEAPAPAPEAPTRAPIPGGEPQVIYNRHTKTGADLWTVQFPERVPPDEYQARLARAKAEGGRYSWYSKNGAIPGYVFTSPEAAQRFVEGERARVGAKPAEAAAPNPRAPSADIAAEATAEGYKPISYTRAMEPWEWGKTIPEPTGGTTHRVNIRYAGEPKQFHAFRSFTVPGVTGGGQKVGSFSSFREAREAAESEIRALPAFQKGAPEAPTASVPPTIKMRPVWPPSAPTVEAPTARPPEPASVAPEAAPPAAAPEAQPARPAYGSTNTMFTNEGREARRARLQARLRGETLTSGFDPELAQDLFYFAGYHIEAGARQFAHFAREMVGDLGEAVRPYLRGLYENARHWPGFEPIAKEMSSPEEIELHLAQEKAAAGRDEDQPTPGLPGQLRIAAWVQRQIEGDIGFDARTLQSAMEHVYGSKLAEGKFTRAEMYDALELGVNRYVAAHPEEFDPHASPERAAAALAKLEKLKNDLPTQTVRAGEKDTFQQFSTPPDYAYVAARVAAIRPEDHVLEPSAGSGSLVAPTLNGGPREVTVNELSENRAPLVESLVAGQPGIRTFRENAEQLHNTLPADVRPTVVIMNPPFSQTAGRMGTRMMPMTGALHVEQALARLAPGGRLVAIVGRGMKMFGSSPERFGEGTGAQFRDWWRRISQNYDVRANIGIPGNVYRKYGTNFGTQLLVIDKVPPTGRPPIVGDAGSLAGAMERLDAIRQGRPRIGGEQVAAQPGGAPVAEPRPPAAEQQPAVLGPAPGGGVRGEPSAGGPRPEVPGGPPAGGGPAPGLEPLSGGRDEMVHGQPERPPEPAGAEPNTASGVGEGEVVGGGGAEPHGMVLQPEGGAGPVLPTGGGSESVAEGPAPVSVQVDEAVADPQPHGEITESVYEPYQPQRIKVEGAKPHPGVLVQSAAMATVMPPAVDYAPRLPRALIDTGALSQAQLEPIVYAGHAHSQFLPEMQLGHLGYSYTADLESEGYRKVGTNAFGASVYRHADGRENVVRDPAAKGWVRVTTNPNGHGVYENEAGERSVTRRGFFDGDGTGVGKGREIAGTILDNFLQGRRKAVWISENTTLLNDARRDWAGVGRNPNEIFEVGKTKAVDDLKPGQGIGFLTYDTLKSAAKAGKDEQGRAIPGRRRLDQLIDWLGKDFDGVIAFDECVPAGTLIATPSGPRSIEKLRTGDVVLGFDHGTNAVISTRVKRTFRRVTLADLYIVGTTALTGNHPVWTAKTGYVPAIWLTPNDVGRYLSQDGKHTHLRLIRAGICDQVPAQSEPFLQSVMYHESNTCPFRLPLQPNDRGRQSCFSGKGPRYAGESARKRKLSSCVARLPRLRPEPVLQPRCRPDSQGTLGGGESTERLRQSGWRQRARPISAAAYAGKETRAWLADGVRYWSEANTAWVSAQLQDRFSKPTAENRYRNRRPRPPSRQSKRERREEGRLPHGSRLDSVSFHQSGYSARSGFRRIADHGGIEVFNIETGTANYFANRLLVHNSHNLANSIAQRGTRGVKDAAQKALAGVELQQKLPNARFLYYSATGATEVSNLAYAERLGLWGRGTPFPNKAEFINQIGAGGIAAMELVARDMKAMGHYVSRNLSYDDVRYDRVEHKLSPEQREIYDGLAEGWQSVLQNIERALLLTGVPDHDTGLPRADSIQRKNALSAFWGAHQRFFNQVITSMQMPSVIKGIEADLREGRQAVLQLVNTNEASQKRAMQKREAASGEGEEGIYEDLDLTPRDQLMQMIDKSFPTIQIEEHVDDNGNVVNQPVHDAAGNPVHNPDALALKEALLDKVGSLRVPDGPLEMVLNHFGVDNVAEVTGRKERIVKKPDATGQVRAQKETRSGKANENETNLFQEGKKRVLTFSQAGGTGRSYHADLGSLSANAQRSHYLVQAGWRADKAIQGFGRTHRTNQASAPVFHLVTTDLQGQRRFISSIARRLSQLGALTKGERRAGESGLFGPKDNLESREAETALSSFWRDLQHGDIGVIEPRDFEAQTGLKLRRNDGGPTDAPEITQFLNRLLSLKFNMQNQVFGEFERRLNDAVDRAAANGTLDIGTETYRADKIKKDLEKTVYTDPKSGAETKYVRLTAEHRNKPASFEQIDSGRHRVVGYSEPRGYVISKRSGKLLAITDGGNRTDARTGVVIPQYRLADPLNWSFVNSHNIDHDFDHQYWEPVPDKAQAKKLWDAQIKALPEFRSEDVHLITGAVLPIWDRLRGYPRVYRLQTDAGERMLGRVITENQIQGVLRSLGAETAAREHTPEQVASRLMQGDQATLVNDWRLRRVMVAGEPRIELTGPYYSHNAELEADGLFKERIGYDTRYFVPTGADAPKVLGKLLADHPIAEFASAAQGAEEAVARFAAAEEPRIQPRIPESYVSPRDLLAEYQRDAPASARDWVLARGRDTGNEHLTLTDPASGRVIGASTSDQKARVALPEGIPAYGSIAEHNHPSGRSLSASDLTVMAVHGTSGIIAHGHNGEAYGAWLPENAASLLGTDPLQAAQHLNTLGLLVRMGADAPLRALVQSRPLHRIIEEANLVAPDLENRALATAGFIHYVSTLDYRKLMGSVMAAAEKSYHGALAELQKHGLYQPPAGGFPSVLADRPARAVRPEDRMGGVFEAAYRAAAGQPGGAGRIAAREAYAELDRQRAALLAARAAAQAREEPERFASEVRGAPHPVDAIMHTDDRGFLPRLMERINEWRQDRPGVRFRSYWQDAFAAIEHQERGQHGGELLPGASSPYIGAQFQKNWQGPLEYALRHGQIRYDPATPGGVTLVPDTKGYEQILAPLRDPQMAKDYAWWVIANRSGRLILEGRERLVTPEMIAGGKAVAEKYGGLFEKIHGELQTWTQSLLDFGVATGIISKEGRESWGRHLDYAPYYRFLEAQEDIAGPRSGGRGIAGQSTPVRELKGGPAKINNIYENYVMNAAAMIRRGMANTAAAKIRDDLALNTEALGRPVSRVPIMLSVDEVNEALRTAGFDPATLDPKERAGFERSLEGQVARTTIATAPARAAGYYSVLENGAPVFYQTKDPLLLQAVNASGPTSLGRIAELFTMPARLLRQAVVFDPAFAVAHNLRMAQHAWMLTGTSPFASISAAIRQARGPDPIALKLMAQGAVSGARHIEGLPVEVRREIMSPDYQASLLDTPAKVYRSLARFGEAVIRASDLGPRVAVYEHAIRQGTSEADALNRARDLLDFSTHGSGLAAMWLAQTVPFLNARWQGLSRTYRGFTGPDRNGLLIRGGLVAAATLALWYQNKDDEEYQRKPDWDRQYAWQIKVGPGEWFRLPKPFELGVLFGTMPEIIASYLNDGSTRELGNAAYSAITNVWKFNPIPIAIRAPLEVWWNRDSYTGQPIVNEREQALVPSERYGPRDSQTVVQLTKAYNSAVPGPFQIAPAQVSHLLQGYLAGWGGYITLATDWLGGELGVLPSSAHPAEIPVAGRFLHEEPSPSNRLQTDFYDLKQAITEVGNTIRQAGKSQDAGYAQALRAAHPEYNPALEKELRKIGAQLSSLGAHYSQAQKNPALSADQKTAVRNQYYIARDRLLDQVKPVLRRAEGLSATP